MALTRYGVAAVQTDVHVASEDDPSSVRRAIETNLARNMELVAYLGMDARYGPRLIAFSEFCLTGVPESRTLAGYQLFGQPIPGLATEIIGEAARKHSVYIACNMFEVDEDWPGRVFNTSFLVDPDGKVILRYRKNNDYQTGILCSTNAGDIYSAYVQRYGGPEALFPVVDTDLGRIGMMTCFDIRFPEVARMLALQGAEVIIHPTAEAVGGPSRSLWDMARQVRAYDNMVYLVSPNNGRTLGGPRPEFRQRGYSRIIDYLGNVMAETDGAGESLVTATVDLDQLREARATQQNMVAISRFGAYVPLYEKYQTWPLDAYLDEPVQDRHQAGRTLKQVIQRQYERGIYRPPRPRVDPS